MLPAAPRIPLASAIRERSRRFDRLAERKSRARSCVQHAAEDRQTSCLVASLDVSANGRAQAESKDSDSFYALQTDLAAAGFTTAVLPVLGVRNRWVLRVDWTADCLAAYLGPSADPSAYDSYGELLSVADCSIAVGAALGRSACIVRHPRPDHPNRSADMAALIQSLSDRGFAAVVEPVREDDGTFLYDEIVVSWDVDTARPAV